MIDNQLQSNADREHPETEQNALVPAVQEAHLIKYDSACRALAEASGVDEVKDVLDQALKLKLYAKIAENKQMERDAVAIRVRAERRLGEMMAAQAKTVGKAKRGLGRVSRRPTAGSDKTRRTPDAGRGRHRQEPRPSCPQASKATAKRSSTRELPKCGRATAALWTSSALPNL